MVEKNTSQLGSFYETYRPVKAKTLLDRFELIYTPKHGRWLNMPKVELRTLSIKHVNRLINIVDEAERQVATWAKERNNKNT